MMSFYVPYTAYEIEVRRRQEMLLAEAEYVRLAALARRSRRSSAHLALRTAAVLRALATWLESTAPSPASGATASRIGK
jgi:hypothetical protein